MSTKSGRASSNDSEGWQEALRRIEEAEKSNTRILDLSGLGLNAIPGSLARLTNLRGLSLDNNQLTALPDSLARLTALTQLFLHGNPGLGIPDEVLGPTWPEVIQGKPPKPPKQILAYYFSQRAESRPLNEAKLILVGQGLVGKTSLVKALTTGKFNSREKTTEGIKISDWPCPLAKNRKVTLHIWDFGGQEMMHATHQCFLTKRTLYLLVLSRRTGGYDKEADYWLRLIRAFGGSDAPVLVVLNKQTSEPFDVNRGGWLEKYVANIRGFVGTDCTDAKTITQLKRKIQEQLQHLKDVSAPFPARWFAIKNELSGMSDDYLSFDDFRQTCAKHKEPDPENQIALAGFLHDLGIALNYKEDPRLRFHVLKPEWVTQGIYALLHGFVASKGLFTRSEAQALLAKKHYSADAADFILGLMEQFELCFRLDDSQKRILIPELLGDQQPDATRDFQPAACLNFGYQYPILPEGLLPRFIVRTHHLSDTATRWRSGVILRDGSTACRALVRADATAEQVRVHIDGPEPSRRELLGVIRYNFEVIHAGFEFKPSELVYPPGGPDSPLKVEALHAIQRSGTPTMPVQLPDGNVITPQITDLVKDVEPLPPPLKLFLSYSHKDEKHVDELRKDLKLLERSGLILPWYDRKLIPSEKWEPRILQELNDADAIVLQLSRDFLASEFCVSTELETAIRRREAGEALLIAYVLHDCGWKETKLAKFQILPKDAKPLADWNHKHKYWRAVAEGIKTALKPLQQRVGQVSGLPRPFRENRRR
ncbi:MAG: COR domain-containing protein [Bryobacteraceae bacterium]